MNTTYNEKEIIVLLQDPARQREAFERIVKEYSEQLYWQIRRLVLSHEDTNDILQNTFIKAWNNIEYFRLNTICCFSGKFLIAWRKIFWVWSPSK